MSANPIWIAGYFGPVAGAAPVWIAPGDGTVPSAVQSEIVSYYAPVAGATAVWIAGFFAPPPAAIGATPITISGWGGSGGGGSGGSTSVWSASDAAANGMTLSNGGLTVTLTTSSSGWQSIRGSISRTTGKLYVEFLVNATDAAGHEIFGLASSGFNPTNYLGSSIYSGGVQYGNTYVSSGFISNYTTAIYSTASGDVWGLAVDFATGNAWIAKNNVWVNSSNPATGTLPIMSFVAATVGALFPAMSQEFATTSFTLQPTAASQKYAPPSGFLAWDSAAPSHSAQALAYLARTVGGNEGGNGANIATLIDGLVSDGVWAQLDALYVLAQQNATDARLNLVGTGYSLTGSGRLGADPRALTFIPYVGFSGFVNGLDTGFNAATAPSPRFTQNNATIGAWVHDYTVDNHPQMGSGTQSHLFIHYSNTFIARINDVGGGAINSTGVNTGLFSGDRPNSTQVYPYMSGTSPGPNSTTSGALDNATFLIGAAQGGLGTTGDTLSAAFIGASLGAAGQLALYNRLRTYMTAVGVP